MPMSGNHRPRGRDEARRTAVPVGFRSIGGLGGWLKNERTEMDDTPDSPVLADKPEFRKALEMVINCYSMENGSHSPDFLLAQYLFDCLAAFDKAVMHREAWYGRVPSYPPSTEPPPTVHLYPE